MPCNEMRMASQLIGLVFLLLFSNAAGWCYDHEIKCTGRARGRSVPIKGPMWRE